jgi:tetratricopeptide (TPR) repeat protein
LPVRGDEQTELLPVAEIVTAGTPVDTSDTDRRIAFWQARIDAGTASETEWVYVGDLLDLKGRQTGDLKHFVAARAAYATAIDIAPNSPAAHSGAARIMATLHDFEGALAAATRTLELDPFENGALGVMFDASVELGDIANAERALAILRERTNSPTVDIRAARLAYVSGDAATAVSLAHEAAAVSASLGEAASTTAFYNYVAAEYELLSGNLEAADAGYADALTLFPGYPIALYGQSRVAYALGDIERATTLAAQAVDASPRPDLVAFLGDLYAVAGNDAAAETQFARVDSIVQATNDSIGPVYAHEYARFLADHRRNPTLALELAEADAATAQDAYAFDTLAWAQRANGLHPEALATVDEALTRAGDDAMVLIHAGLIEIDNGLEAEGRAHIEQGLALKPVFSPVVIEEARAAIGG